jgi:phospholipase C
VTRAQKLSLPLAGTLLIASYSSGSGGPVWGAIDRRAPVVEADTLTTATPIKHVIFIIKENRSFDTMFGRFPGANGATTGWDHGTERPLTRGTVNHTADLPHDYPAALRSWDRGKMDGFSQDSVSDRWAYTQFRPEQLPDLWQWAQDFVLADNFFASAAGPSFPNHLYAIAASSGGAHDSPVASNVKRLWYKTWGCDSPPGEFVIVEDSDGKTKRVPPCFDMRTLGGELDAKGIPWAFYAQPPVSRQKRMHSGYIWSAYSAIPRYRNHPKRWAQHVFRVSDLFSDLRRGAIPPVTWVTPIFAFSDHPGASFCWGEHWTAKVIDAIMRSRIWKSTAIFLTWDEWGGFYDHVPPPQIDRFGLGIRVPLLMISPYAKHGFIEHDHGEFSSVLRFIENNWGLRRLTKRDAQAGDLTSAFDFGRMARGPDILAPRTDCKGDPYHPASWLSSSRGQAHDVEVDVAPGRPMSPDKAVLPPLPGIGLPTRLKA